ncbi:MAG: ABC transporter ATP-binding protein [Deltaproteobacteria bacterium]|nr:ABC transporter ATP-binding protein [Deltaproteobacteria bacterium]
MADKPLLSIQGLVTEFRTEGGTVRAVDGVSFDIPRGKTLGVVGESGCGKSVTALSVMRLIQTPPGRIAAGKILYDGKDLLTLPETEMRHIRGNKISMIFQEPMTSLNPVYTTGDQVVEAIRLHQGLGKAAARAKAVEMFQLVGIPSPEERIHAYPHQMSGGMRQRVMIAMALACKPDLLIADEPTTALDVTIQAQILELLAKLQRELGMSILLITHDLGVVAETCDDVIVMYAGRVVEQAKATDLFGKPRHRYTQGLLRSVPSFTAIAARAARTEEESAAASGPRVRKRLQEIPGMVPSLLELPTGCKFQGRCTYVEDDCKAKEPELIEGEHRHRCFHPVSAEAPASASDAEVSA